MVSDGKEVFLDLLRKGEEQRQNSSAFQEKAETPKTASLHLACHARHVSMTTGRGLTQPLCQYRVQMTSERPPSK